MVKQAIIPLAGLGTRLLPLSSITPKELLPINGKSNLEHILDECIEAGIKEFIFIISKKKESIRKIEEQSDINAELTEKENQQMNREISEIVLRADGKLRCLFNPTDPIYQLSEETKDMPNDQEKQ